MGYESKLTRQLYDTARRNGDKKIDAELTANLLADPKENAEHVMLVHLGKNLHTFAAGCHSFRCAFAVLFPLPESFLIGQGKRLLYAEGSSRLPLLH